MKAAAEALETGNRDLAQAILDGASITLPSGKSTSDLPQFLIRYVLDIVPTMILLQFC